MANIEDVKKIREMTGVPLGAIKKALEEADGKIEQALKFLKERGGAVAEKKAGRQTGEGLVSSYIHANGKIGVLIEMFCETDFVARNDEFKNLGHELAMHIAATNPADVDELLGQPYIRDQDITVDALVKNHIAKLGENIRIGEFCRFEI
ncbi:MAG: translation elongation factor Ts [Parcubacteria group bacterium]|nr:translation elongation factor Ts [Parcubacteria group bacterium]